MKMNNQYKYVVCNDVQIHVFCPKCLQLFYHAASFDTFPFKEKIYFPLLSREFPSTNYMEAQLNLSKNYLYNKPRFTIVMKLERLVAFSCGPWCQA